MSAGTAGTAAPGGAAGMEHPWVPGRQGASTSPLPLHGQGSQAAAQGRPHRHRLPGTGVLARQPAPGERRPGGAGWRAQPWHHSRPRPGQRGWEAQGVPPTPRMMLWLQPGAPNVLEQGPERRNCHTTRVQLVSGGVQAPLGLPVDTGHTQCLCQDVELPQWVPIHLTPGCAHILG